MAYLGEKPSQTLASPTSQYFNGDGSTVAFTLNRAVNVAEDLDVFVNNVRQEPGVGKSYTAIGTTLTFDAAPSAGTDNVYVVYRGLAEVTTRLEHPSNSPIAATNGTFSGAISATTGTFSGAVSGTTGTFSGAVSAASATVTGDLTVDTNTLYVDSTNNRVGIGTSSPLTPLNASYIDASRNDLLLLTNRNTSGYGPWINFYGDYNGGYSFAKIGAENDSTGGSMRFHTANTSGTSTEQMRIDNSGRVTMPNQPSFMAYGAWSYDSNYIWKGFATVDHNIGSHWNNATGRFTAPVAGRYMIYATNHHNASSTYHLWAFLKNGSLGGGNWVQSYNAGSGYHTTSKQQVWDLAAGDYLEIASNSSYANGYTSGYTAVGAYLVG